MTPFLHVKTAAFQEFPMVTIQRIEYNQVGQQQI